MVGRLRAMSPVVAPMMAAEPMRVVAVATQAMAAT
jgi:hypothetical protein